MKPLVLVGIVLVVLGVLGFAFPRIDFTRSEEVIDLGPVEVDAERERTVPIPEIASGAAIVAGVALAAAGARTGKAG